MYEYPPKIVFADFSDEVETDEDSESGPILAMRSPLDKQHGLSIDRRDCGIKSVELENNAGTRSISYNDVSNPHTDIAWDDANRLNFAPKAENEDPEEKPDWATGKTESVSIHWSLRNPAMIDYALIELFHRDSECALKSWYLDWNGSKLEHVEYHPGNRDDPLWPTDGRDASDPSERGESGDLAWDGSIPYDETLSCNDHLITDFASKCVNTAMSPYKIKMTLTAKADIARRPAQAWTYFDIVVEKIEMAWFPESLYEKVLPPSTLNRDRLVYESLLLDDPDNLNGAFPVLETETKRVFLEGNVFYKASPELEDNTFYSRWRTKWGDGPNIPILATTYLKDSEGNPVLAPWAVGELQLLWDWVDKGRDWNLADEEPTVPHNDTNILDFLKNSQDYKSAETADGPSGKNCHLDRGGKRGPEAKPIFPNRIAMTPVAQLQTPTTYTPDTEVFPFSVFNNRDQGNRKWTAISTSWSTGLFMGQTGVVFQPSRMPGDGYELHCFVASGNTLDDVLNGTNVDEDPITAGHAKSGRFQVWRRVDISGYLRIGPGAPQDAGDALDVDQMQTAFLGAYTYLDFQNATPENANNKFRLALEKVAAGTIGSTEDYVRHAIDLENRNGLIEFRSHED